MAIFGDFKGTSQSSFQIQKGGARFKNNSGTLESRNAANSAYADFVANILRAAGDSIVLNNDAAGSGADWLMTIARPSSGMTAAITYTLPATVTNGYILSTDGSGNLTWVAPAASTAANITRETTTLVFGDSSPVAMFTLPANAVIDRVSVIIDTAFDGAPTLEIGISGTVDKYMDATQVDLTDAAQSRYESHPNHAPLGTSESIIATYADGGATAGSARLVVDYSIPS